MIFVSSAGVPSERISDAVRLLAVSGFKDIELSGGTRPYAGLQDDLHRLKAEHGLTYLLHNYFPPPASDFVINLASLDAEMSVRSFAQLQRAIELSRKLEASKFGFHAGFYLDVQPGELGKRIAERVLAGKEQAMERFCDRFERLRRQAGGIELYLENNVLSASNARQFGGINPLMLTDFDGFLELKRRLDFKMLLDVGHLKVSAHSLDLDFDQQLTNFMSVSDYVHLSDNNGLQDQNFGFEEDSTLLKQLKAFDWRGKIVTLEIYGPIESIKNSSMLCTQHLSGLGERAG